MSDITVNVTNAGAANIAVSNGSTFNATVGNGGSVNVSLGTISPGNATVVSGTLTINGTTTLAPGSNATVTNSGTAYAAVLDFGIPAGATGPAGINGTTPSFSIGNVTTLSAGSNATVSAASSNSGANVTLNFGIPQGAVGAAATLTLSDATPSALGTASAGTSNLPSRSDHVHALPVIAWGDLTGTPANFPTNTSLVSGLNTTYAAINHAHDYVTSLNNLTGSLTLAAGSNVSLATNGSTLTLSSTGGGIGANDAVDGGTYVGVIGYQNTITITQQPTNQTASNGTATFAVAATVSPTGTPTYQWQKSDNGGSTWAHVSGGTSASLALTGLTNANDNGDRYRCAVSATGALSVTSSAVALTVPSGSAILVGSTSGVGFLPWSGLGTVSSQLALTDVYFNSEANQTVGIITVVQSGTYSYYWTSTGSSLRNVSLHQNEQYLNDGTEMTAVVELTAGDILKLRFNTSNANDRMTFGINKNSQ